MTTPRTTEHSVSRPPRRRVQLPRRECVRVERPQREYVPRSWVTALLPFDRARARPSDFAPGCVE